MSNEFTALRAKARERRDLEIAKAREDYETSLLRIAELEQRLLGKDDPRRIKLSAAVERVIPRDQPFNVNDIMHSLEALDPSRVWQRTSVARHVTKLRELGLVKRVKRATVDNPAAYVRSNNQHDDETQQKPLRQVVTEVVIRPMYIAEVVAAVLAAGYKTTMIAGHFRTHCIAQLRAAGFKREGGKWVG